jgi:hypothetical protein
MKERNNIGRVRYDGLTDVKKGICQYSDIQAVIHGD